MASLAAPSPKRARLSLLLRFYRVPGLTTTSTATLLSKIRSDVSGCASVTQIQTEFCFYVECARALTSEETRVLHWLLAETYEPDSCRADVSFMAPPDPSCAAIVEIGPRLSFTSAFATNAVSICRACGLGDVVLRVERATRYRVEWDGGAGSFDRAHFTSAVHDRMTQMVYERPLDTFGDPADPKPTRRIPVVAEGRPALEKISSEMGLAFDDWDLDFYTKLFRDDMGRDPTDVEIFDMAQSNSEHSRHWFFGGRMVIDGEEKPTTLFRMVKDTLTGDNSVIAFHDNSSAIRGFPVQTLVPDDVGSPAAVRPRELTLHPILTAETHNFPSGVAPFPGATTGTGGRLRDVQATGRGAHTLAGTAAYCVGNLHIPGYELPWESKESTDYPSNLARPLEIIVEASNGASDYGNKFGEPLVLGYTRSFGMRLPNGERREWVKPIMFTAGIGQLDSRHVTKGSPEPSMLVVKVGGPCYRIGIGGGAASSRVQDAKEADLDFDAVQRGDAEMENKMNRLIRACVELGDDNPIISIHDQGAGGNSNVLKEIAEPAGCRLELRKILLGDPSLSVLEIWGSEYQENCALLIRPQHEELFAKIAERENCPFSVLGVVTGDGRVVVHDSRDGSTPVDLDLEKVLGKLPQKTFRDQRVDRAAFLRPMAPLSADVGRDLNGVLRLLSVASKRFLTNKVDRSVTGLVAQQQCVGPLHIPCADVAVLAQSHFPHAEGAPMTGIATSVGEQPVKGLVDPAAMARMSVGEMLTNLVWARCTSLRDVKCSGNWMWAAKLPSEAAAMWDTCKAMSDCLLALGVSIDGGKDSLSMAARASGETIKAPGALVLSSYCTCPDVSMTVTPDLKLPDGTSGNNALNSGAESGVLLFVDLARGKMRMGGSALAQTRSEIGSVAPDMDDPKAFAAAFEATQALLEQRLLCAGHDRSDGGLITAILEMAFTGNCGVELNIPETACPAGADPTAFLFNEELGLVVETSAADAAAVVATFEAAGAACHRIGRSVCADTISLCFEAGHQHAEFAGKMTGLRDVWEATGFQLEQRQANPACVALEQAGLKARRAPPISMTFTPTPTPTSLLSLGNKPSVAVMRDEGSNGDREMISALYAAGFQPWDIHVRDLLMGKITLDRFRGVVFVGGFSYADTLDSAKGWAGTLMFNGTVWDQLQAFYAREDTISLGVCNGCQLMSLLGWVPGTVGHAAATTSGENKTQEGTPANQPRFVHNKSGRFESRFSTVKIVDSPASAVWLNGMVGSVLGVWVAHGEGQVLYPDASVQQTVNEERLAPVVYVDDSGNPTEQYPFNPNGSQGGVTALCSRNGRHLAMMPHPERCFTAWQQPWMPQQYAKTLKAGPWLRMFQNAREWCVGNSL